MASGVKGDHIRHTSMTRSEHRKRRDCIMDALAMYKIPAVVVADHFSYFGREVIITSTWPRGNTQNHSSIYNFLRRKSAGYVSCQHSDVEVRHPGESPRDFVDVCLDAADLRKITRAYHQD